MENGLTLRRLLSIRTGTDSSEYSSGLERDQYEYDYTLPEFELIQSAMALVSLVTKCDCLRTLMGIDRRWENSPPNISNYFAIAGRLPTPLQIRKPARRLNETESDLIDRYLVKFYLSFEWLETTSSSQQSSSLRSADRQRKPSAEALLTEFGASQKEGHKEFMELYKYLQLRFGDLNKIDHDHFFRKATDGSFIIKKAEAIPPPKISNFTGVSSVMREDQA